MNIFPETDVDSLDPKNRRQIIGMARESLQGGDPGTFCTVDQDYTLTSTTSRKVAQIQENPTVHWMFSNRDLTFVVNLTGRAEIYLHERTR